MTMTAEMAQLAVELIDEFGGTVTITYAERGGEYDNDTATVGPGVVIPPATVKALIEPKGMWMGKELGVRGEMKLTVASKNLSKPEPGDKFKVNGTPYTVFEKGVVETFVEDAPVIYEVYGERG